MSEIRNVGWSIGAYCNLRCRHCYSARMRASSESRLEAAEAMRIAGKLINYGIQTCNFGGNEPIFTDGPDPTQSFLPDLVAFMYDQNVAVGVTSNGTTAIALYNVDTDVFGYVADWDFSLDSPFPQEHNSNRGSSRSFDVVREAVTLCKSQSRQRSIVMTGMEWNLTDRHLGAMLELVAGWDAELRINLLKPTGKAEKSQMPSREQFVNAWQFMLDHADLVSISEPTVGAAADAYTEGCPCGDSSFRIRCKKSGRVPVSPCVYLDIDAGDILTDCIDSIVSNPVFLALRSRKENIPAECRGASCPIVETCRGGCAARTWLATGDFDKKDPYCTLKPSMKSPSDFHSYYGPVRPHPRDSTCDRLRVHEGYLCTWIVSPRNLGLDGK